MRRPLPLVALALAALVLLSGCPDDRPPVPARDGRVGLTLDDFSITPQRVEARPGRLSFDVVNRGRAAHNLVVRRGERELEPRLPSLKGGERGSVSVRVRRGAYTLACSLANHEELGASGILTVR